jgi:hypothetical protein
MSKMSIVTIERLEVKKSDIDKVKKIFKVKDNTEAIRKALDVATGKIELEAIFEKYKGTKLKKVYV